MPPERYSCGENDDGGAYYSNEHDDFDPRIPRSIACVVKDPDKDDALMGPQRRSLSRRSKGIRRSTISDDKSPRAFDRDNLRQSSMHCNERNRPIISVSTHSKYLPHRQQRISNNELRASSFHVTCPTLSPMKPILPIKPHDDIDYEYEGMEPVKRSASRQQSSPALSPRRVDHSRETPKRLERKAAVATSSPQLPRRSPSKHLGCEPLARRREASGRDASDKPFQRPGSNSLPRESSHSGLEPKRREASSVRRTKSRAEDCQYVSSQMDHEQSTTRIHRRSRTPPKEVAVAADDASARRLRRHESSTPVRRTKPPLGMTPSSLTRHCKDAVERVRPMPTSPSPRSVQGKVQLDSATIGIDRLDGNDKELDRSSRRKQRTTSVRREERPKNKATTGTDVECNRDHRDSKLRTMFQMLSPKQNKKDPIGRSKSQTVEGFMLFAALSTDTNLAAESKAAARGLARSRTTVRRSRTNAGMHTLLRAPSLSPTSTAPKERKVLRKPSGDAVLDISPVPRRTVLRKPSSSKSQSQKSPSQLLDSRGQDSDNSTISSCNINDGDPTPVLQFDPERSTALQVDLNDIPANPLDDFVHCNESSQRSLTLLAPIVTEESAFSAKVHHTPLYSPLKTNTTISRVSSVWTDDEDSEYSKPQVLYSPIKRDEVSFSKQPAELAPSQGKSGDEPQSDKHNFDTSFGQIVVDRFRISSLEPESGDEELSHRKLENQQLKKTKEKKNRKITKTAPVSTDCGEDSEQSTRPQRSRRVMQEASSEKHRFAASIIATNFMNGHLTNETDTKDENAQPPVLKDFAVKVSNNQTPYESEADITPRQTPLKKRLGFSQYFRGKMKSATMSPGVVHAETSDSEASFGSSKRKDAFRRGADHSMLLGSSGSENEILLMS